MRVILARRARARWKNEKRRPSQNGPLIPRLIAGSRLVFLHWHNSLTDSPRLYDQQRNNRDKVSTNPYYSDSTSIPYGRYGSPFSPDSINNLYGGGNP